MKTYCKPATVNIEDWKFNEIAVIECFRNKRARNDFQRLLCKTGKITKRELAEDQLNQDFRRTLEVESEVAKMLTQRIINRDLQLKPIRQFKRIDGLTQKLRDICQESPEQQVFEYIGVYALKPLFRAKILPIQYGSIPNKEGVSENNYPKIAKFSKDMKQYAKKKKYELMTNFYLKSGKDRFWVMKPFYEENILEGRIFRYHEGKIQCVFKFREP